MNIMSNPLKYIFIVPYRDREPHKVFFQKYMETILEDYTPESYLILFVHQKNKLLFNRGAMKNIGFLYIKEKYPKQYKDMIFIFNDVDTVPYRKGLLNYDVPFGEIKHFYGYTFALGGIFSIRGKDFEMLQGFPNYWSWGFEDNVIYKRAVQKKMKINRDTFFTIKDISILHFFDDLHKHIEKNTLDKQFNKSYVESDGLNHLKQIKYTFNHETNMLDVASFVSKYPSNNLSMMEYNVSSGSKITKKKRSGIKMNFF